MDEEQIISGYPLQWPVQYPRTKAGDRDYGQFKQSPDSARKKLLHELYLLGASNIVISSNVPLRNDGQMRSDYAKLTSRADSDPGVAVYFKRKGKDLVLPCDKFNAVWKNVYALALAIESLRRIERYKIPHFIDNAFSGFQKLLPGSYKDPWKILELHPDSVESEIDAAYKDLAKKLHPDAGGSEEQMRDLNWARDEAKRLNKDR